MQLAPPKFTDKHAGRSFVSLKKGICPSLGVFDLSMRIKFTIKIRGRDSLFQQCRPGKEGCRAAYIGDTRFAYRTIGRWIFSTCVFSGVCV